jgi:hypothetical protein
MALVRTFTLPHYETFPVHVALFKDVKNASYLKSQLLQANPEFDYAFLDADMVRFGYFPVHKYTLSFDFAQPSLESVLLPFRIDHYSPKLKTQFDPHSR